MEFCLGDRLFVALAKRVGFPSYDTLRRCRGLQLEWIESGPAVSLFSVVQIEGVIDPRQAARFIAWGKELSGRHHLKATREQPSSLGLASAAPSPPPSSPRDGAPAREGTEILSRLPATRSRSDRSAKSKASEASIEESPADEPLLLDDEGEDEPLFLDDEGEDEPLFLDDEGEGLFAEADHDRPGAELEDEDTGTLRLLPEDDEAERELLRQCADRRRVSQRRAPEVMDDREADLIAEDEASEVFEVRATWSDAERHTKSAADLGLEEDPLKGVFEALDAQSAERAVRARTGESRLGGLIQVFDDFDPSDASGSNDQNTYTEDEVLELIESEDRLRAKETQERNWRDTWREDGASPQGGDSEIHSSSFAQRGRAGRPRSSRRLAASSGSCRALRRRPGAPQPPTPRRRRDRS